MDRLISIETNADKMEEWEYVGDHPILKKQLEPLIETIKGPAADIATMWKAYHILEAIEKADKDE